MHRIQDNLLPHNIHLNSCEWEHRRSCSLRSLVMRAYNFGKIDLSQLLVRICSPLPPHAQASCSAWPTELPATQVTALTFCPSTPSPQHYITPANQWTLWRIRIPRLAGDAAAAAHAHQHLLQFLEVHYTAANFRAFLAGFRSQRLRLIKPPGQAGAADDPGYATLPGIRPTCSPTSATSGEARVMIAQRTAQEEGMTELFSFAMLGSASPRSCPSQRATRARDVVTATSCCTTSRRPGNTLDTLQSLTASRLRDGNGPDVVIQDHRLRPDGILLTDGIWRMTTRMSASFWQ